MNAESVRVDYQELEEAYDVLCALRYELHKDYASLEELQDMQANFYSRVANAARDLDKYIKQV